jgi:hypothetical protein
MKRDLSSSDTADIIVDADCSIMHVGSMHFYMKQPILVTVQ